MTDIQSIGTPTPFDSTRHVDEQDNDIHMGGIETVFNILSSEIAKHKIERKDDITLTQASVIYEEAGREVRQFAASHGIYSEKLPKPRKSYRQIVKEEAARIAEEERQEALEAESRTGLWGQLPEGGK